MESKEEKQAHKELDKKIKSCTCLPISHGEKYCEECHDLVIGFMDKYGAGVLTRDEHLKDLEDYCKETDECNGRQAVIISKLRSEIQELKLKSKEE